MGANREAARLLAQQLVAGQLKYNAGGGNDPNPNNPQGDDVGFEKFGKLGLNPPFAGQADQGAAPAPGPNPNNPNDPMVMILEGLKKLQQHQQAGNPDPEAMRKIIKEELAKQPPKVLEIRPKDKPAVQIEQPHPQFEDLLKLVVSNVPAWVVGPAGSGKTHAAEQVAQALSLDFHPQSVCQQTGLHHIMGYVDAGGVFHDTPFTKAFRNGGIYLIDEIDRGNPNVLLCLNSATANGFSTFGNGEHVKKHADFRVVACANTFGTGPNAEYVGACKADAAVLDRFAYLQWKYDTDLEIKLTGDHVLTRIFHKAREVAAEKGIRVIISTRKMLNALKLHTEFQDPIQVLKLSMGGINDEMFNQLFADAPKLIADNEKQAARAAKAG